MCLGPSLSRLIYVWRKLLHWTSNFLKQLKYKSSWFEGHTNQKPLTKEVKFDEAVSTIQSCRFFKAYHSQKKKVKDNIFKRRSSRWNLWLLQKKT